MDVVVSAAPNSPEVQEFDTARVVPVHFSNPDIFWKAAHSQPRFGQGAFRLAFETLLRSRYMLLKVWGVLGWRVVGAGGLKKTGWFYAPGAAACETARWWRTSTLTPVRLLCCLCVCALH